MREKKETILKMIITELLPVWPLFGVAIWKTLLPILVEPLAHCINPPIPDGDDIDISQLEDQEASMEFQPSGEMVITLPENVQKDGAQTLF